MRLGHAHVLTVHRTVIHCARAAPLPQGEGYWFVCRNKENEPQNFIIFGAIHTSPVFTYDNRSFREGKPLPYGFYYISL